MQEKIETETPKNASILTGASKRYIGFIVFYVCAYAFVDGYLTAIPIHIQYNATAELLAGNLADFYMIQAIASLGLIAVFGLQVLADVLGRKLTILISFVGMAASSAFMAFAQNAAQFTAAFFLSFMFVSTDAWIILIGEDGDKEKRGRIVLWIWIMSVVSTIIAPLLKKFIIPPGAPISAWRILPMLLIVALPIALLGLLIKESSAYTKQKVKRTEPRSLKTLSKVWQGEHRNKLLAFMFAGVYFGFGYSSISTYTTFLNNLFMDSTSAISTNVFIIMSFCAITSYLLVGPLSDRIGRKKVSVILGIIILGTTFILFAIADWGIIPGDKFAIVSGLSGAFFGAYWSFSGINRVHCLEVFPTEIRGTSTGWRSFAYALGVVGGSALASGLSRFTSLGSLLFLFSLFIVPLLIVNHFTLPETKKTAIA